MSPRRVAERWDYPYPLKVELHDGTTVDVLLHPRTMEELDALQASKASDAEYADSLLHSIEGEHHGTALSWMVYQCTRAALRFFRGTIPVPSGREEPDTAPDTERETPRASGHV